MRIGVHVHDDDPIAAAEQPGIRVPSRKALTQHAAAVAGDIAWLRAQLSS